MSRSADLAPPLGFPGGPCHVVRRVHEEADNPRVRERLTDKVEKGKSLSNPEAAQVYDLEGERGVGLFKQVVIGPHAQYRMDLRGIVVPEIRVALATFQKQLNDWKSRQDIQWQLHSEMLARGEPVEWTDPRIKLTIVFVVVGRGRVKLVTAYWKGEPDPKGPGPGRCPLVGSQGFRNPAGDLAGVRTWVTDPNADQPPATSHGRYKQRALPTPPWVHKKPTKNWVYNVPGPSDEAPGGKTLHKDRVRTKGEPGKPPSDAPPRKRPKRREIEGAVRGKPYPSSQERQRKQRAQAKRYYQRWYRRNRSTLRRRSERWYRRWRRRIQFKRDKQRRRRHPNRFERRPGGGVKTLGERSKKWRAKQKKKRRGKPKKAFQPIPFIHLPANRYGLLMSIDPDTGMARVEISPVEYNPDTDAHVLLGGMPQEIPVETFMQEALVTNEADIERLGDYLDDVFDWGGDGEDDGVDDEPEIDQVLDEWLEGSGFQVVAYKVRQRPKKRQRRQKGQARIKARQRYRKNRHRYRQKAKMRYKRLRKNPLFKRQQKIRKKNPQRFKRRRGHVLTAPEIAFIIGRSYQLGYVHSVSPMTGLVTFQRGDNEENITDWQSLPVPDFLAAVGFLSDADIEAMFRLIDAEIGLEGYKELTQAGVRQSALLEDVDCDSEEFKDECENLTGKRELGEMTPAELTKVDAFVVNTVVYDDPDDEEPHGDETVTPEDRYMIDPTDDDYIYGTVNVPEDWLPVVRRVACRYSDILIEKRPPDDRETWKDRGMPNLVKEIDREEHTPANKMDRGQVTDNPGSAKVMPNNKDLVNNTDWKTWGWDPPRLPDITANIERQAILDLGEHEQEALVELVKSPMWEGYSTGRFRLKDIFRWFRDKGVRMTARRWNQIMNRLQHMLPARGRLATRISEIWDQCSPELHERARTIPVKLRRVDARNAVWLFDARGTSGTYRVRVKARAKKSVRDPRKADVLISCSCPFWRWQGPEHWAKKGDFLYGRPRGTATKPDIKDPKGQHWACKHVLACLSKILTYTIPGRGRGRRAALRYLADRIESGRVRIFFEREARIIQAVADRYLETRR